VFVDTTSSMDYVTSQCLRFFLIPHKAYILNRKI